jgi:Flp pilus assembly protein TadG
MTGTNTVGTRRSPYRAGLRHRRGLAGVWVIAAGPALLTMLCFTLEIGNLWLARGELETALEAAALAAVKEWRDTNSASQARDFAVVYAAANTIAGAPVILSRNDGGGGVHGNLVCNGEIVLGEIRGANCDSFVFDANSSPVAAYGVRTRKTAQVTPVFQNLFGVPIGPFFVSAQVEAMCEAPEGLPKLVRISQYLCN